MHAQQVCQCMPEMCLTQDKTACNQTRLSGITYNAHSQTLFAVDNIRK